MKVLSPKESANILLSEDLINGQKRLRTYTPQSIFNRKFSNPDYVCPLCKDTGIILINVCGEYEKDICDCIELGGSL